MLQLSAKGFRQSQSKLTITSRNHKPETDKSNPLFFTTSNLARNLPGVKLARNNFDRSAEQTTFRTTDAGKLL